MFFFQFKHLIMTIVSSLTHGLLRIVLQNLYTFEEMSLDIYLLPTLRLIEFVLWFSI